MDTLIRYADVAMYHAKSLSHQKGTSHYCFYHSDMVQTNQSPDANKPQREVVAKEANGDGHEQTQTEQI